MVASVCAITAFIVIHGAAAWFIIADEAAPPLLTVDSVANVAATLTGVVTVIAGAALIVPAPRPLPTSTTSRVRARLLAAARCTGLGRVPDRRIRSILVVAYLSAYFIVGAAALVAYLIAVDAAPAYTQGLGLVTFGVVIALVNAQFLD